MYTTLFKENWIFWKTLGQSPWKCRETPEIEDECVEIPFTSTESLNWRFS